MVLKLYLRVSPEQGSSHELEVSTQVIPNYFFLNDVVLTKKIFLKKKVNQFFTRVLTRSWNDLGFY